MSKQKTKQSRELLNNPRLYQDAASDAKNMLACTTWSVSDNTVYGVDDLSTGMLRAAIMDSVGGCANAVKQKNEQYAIRQMVCICNQGDIRGISTGCFPITDSKTG